MITGVNHVSYTVTDMDRSVAFYRDGLGYSVVSDRNISGEFPKTVTGFDEADMRIIHLRGHGQGLELIQYREPEGAERAPRTCDAGSSHICFDVEDMDPLVERLKELGATFLSEPVPVEGGPNAGKRMVYFLDPDGIPMEFSEYKS